MSNFLLMLTLRQTSDLGLLGHIRDNEDVREPGHYLSLYSSFYAQLNIKYCTLE